MSDVYATSSTRFDQYKDMKGTDLPSDPLSSLQLELYRWRVKNFGTPDLIAGALGMGEELGELAEAVFGSLLFADSFTPKSVERFERAVREPSNWTTIEPVLDAVADGLVFCTQICTALGLDFGTLLTEAMNKEIDLDVSPPSSIRPNQFLDLSNIGYALIGMSAAVGRIQHATLKSHQKIRGYDNPEKGRKEIASAVMHYCAFSAVICMTLGKSTFTTYMEVAKKVLKRDWSTNKTTGGEC